MSFSVKNNAIRNMTTENVILWMRSLGYRLPKIRNINVRVEADRIIKEIATQKISSFIIGDLASIIGSYTNDFVPVDTTIRPVIDEEVEKFYAEYISGKK